MDNGAATAFAEGTRFMQLAIACVGVGLIVSGALDLRKRRKNGQKSGFGDLGQIVAGVVILLFCLAVPYLVAP